MLVESYSFLGRSMTRTKLTVKKIKNKSNDENKLFAPVPLFG